MHRILFTAGALALTLPSLAAAQDWGHRRNDHRRRSTGVSVSIGIGNNATLGIGIHSSSHRSTPIVHRVRHRNDFTVVGQRGDWFIVDYGFGRRGWVHCSDLPGYRYRGPTTVIINDGPVTPAPVVIGQPTIIRNHHELVQLDRFNYRRELKSNGALQSSLSLVRLPDHTYQIEYASAAYGTGSVRVTQGSVQGLRQQLSRMQAFPNASYERGVDTFYTTFSTDGCLSNGRALNMSRAFYDVSFEPHNAELANGLHQTVDQLIAGIAAQTGNGFTGHFGR